MRRRFLIIALLSGFWASNAVAQQRAEKFEYQVTWANSDVATLKLRRGCQRDGYVPAALTAGSLGVAEQIHSFQIRLDSFTNGGGHPLEGRTFIVEEGLKRQFKTRFREDGSAKVTKKFRQKTSIRRVRFERPTHDLLSWAFQLRTETMRPGNTFTYYVWDGWKLVRLRATVKKAERIWTPDGTHKAWRVKLERTRLHHRGEKAYEPKADTERVGVIWYSKTENRIPIAMDFDAPVGVAKIRLRRAKSSACP